MTNHRKPWDEPAEERKPPEEQPAEQSVPQEPDFWRRSTPDRTYMEAPDDWPPPPDESNSNKAQD
jgi:hypothetical protein